MKSIKHTAAFEIDQSSDKLFPLFSAEGEKAWVPGWDYENIMGSTDLCEDYVFVTGNHDHAAGKAVWIVKTYEPESCLVQFYKIEPENKVGIITVQCIAKTKNRTRVEVTYHYIALSKRGSNFISNFTPENYEKFIGQWQKLLVDYFNRFFDRLSLTGEKE